MMRRRREERVKGMKGVPVRVPGCMAFCFCVAFLMQTRTITTRMSVSEQGASLCLESYNRMLVLGTVDVCTVAAPACKYGCKCSDGEVASRVGIFLLFILTPLDTSVGMRVRVLNR